MDLTASEFGPDGDGLRAAETIDLMVSEFGTDIQDDMPAVVQVQENDLVDSKSATDIQDDRPAAVQVQENDLVDSKSATDIQDGMPAVVQVQENVLVDSKSAFDVQEMRDTVMLDADRLPDGRRCTCSCGFFAHSLDCRLWLFSRTSMCLVRGRSRAEDASQAEQTSKLEVQQRSYSTIQRQKTPSHVVIDPVEDHVHSPMGD